jgi:hypothetical protein
MVFMSSFLFISFIVYCFMLHILQYLALNVFTKTSYSCDILLIRYQILLSQYIYVLLTEVGSFWCCTRHVIFCNITLNYVFGNRFMHCG